MLNKLLYIKKGCKPMMIFKLIDRYRYKVAFFSRGGISIRELAHKLFMKFKWCSSIKNVVDYLRSEKLLKKDIIETKDLQRVFSFRFMSRKEREIAKELCLAVNARFTKLSYGLHVERVRDILEHNAYWLSTMWLSDAEVLANVGGLFVIAGDIRKLCVKKLLEKYEKKSNVQHFDVIKLYSCYLYAGENAKAAEVIERAGKAWRYYNDGVWQRMVVMAKSKNLDELSAMMKLETKADAEYSEMIRGKRIAFIGPAVGSLDEAELTRDFDLIVCMNYRGKGLLSEAEQRCGIDISYYGGNYGNRIFEMDDKSFMLDLKAVVFKTIVNNTQKAMFHDGKCRKVQCSPNTFMFQKAAFQAQVTLLDLLHFAPARIKVFNINLFLTDSDKRYRKGYYDGGIMNTGSNISSAHKLWSSLTTHNIISNYEVTKFWYDSGFIEADRQLSEILSLGTSEYLSRLETLE